MEPLYHQLIQKQLNAIKPAAASYIFAGPQGVGRSLAAQILARRLNCPAGGDNCAICQNILAGSYPDLIIVESDKAIGIEDIARLQRRLANTVLESTTTRLAVIKVASQITVEAQNRLLKTLEEPPPRTIIIIVAGNPDQLLPTIRSRCRLVNFLPLPADQLVAFLTKAIPDQAAAILTLMPETIGQALRLAQDQAEREGRVRLVGLIKQFNGANLFERLTLVTRERLADQVQAIINLLPQLIDQHQAKKYLAIEKAEMRLRANVGGRSVLEALALEL
jgi:DNA polymerase-3 subunit delta'